MANRFAYLVGVGGVGSGMFLRLRDNHTLGRNESRAGTILRRRDFCKLHIIAHYVARLAGRGLRVFPVARIGDDDIGAQLKGQMQQAGMDVRFVQPMAGRSTLFSVCWLYPDGEGGNVTTDDSACAELTASDVSAAMEGIGRQLGSLEGGIVLAAPEVPLDVRLALLEQGRRCGAFNVAAITTAEVTQALAGGLAGLTDLLSVNQDEAAALAGMSAGEPLEKIVAAAGDRLGRENPAIRLCVTAGGDGAFGWEGGRIEHTPAPKVTVANTAGAGDATLAGLIVGLAAGLPFILPDRPMRESLSDQPLATCLDLSALLSGLSVESEDTINFQADAAAIAGLAHRLDADASALTPALTL